MRANSMPPKLQSLFGDRIVDPHNCEFAHVPTFPDRHIAPWTPKSSTTSILLVPVRQVLYPSLLVRRLNRAYSLHGMALSDNDRQATLLLIALIDDQRFGDASWFRGVVASRGDTSLDDWLGWNGLDSVYRCICCGAGGSAGMNSACSYHVVPITADPSWPC